MDDLTQKLNDLLSSPDSMQKIQSALAALGADGDDEDEAEDSAPTLADQLPDSDTLTSLLSAFASGQAAPSPKKDKMVVRPKKDAGSGMPDLSMLTKLMPLMSSMNRDDDDTNLLKALRPYLRGDREKRLDDAIKILRLMKIMPLLQDKGLF